MNNTYPTDVVPASVEYVLSVIRDNHRQQCQVDFEADSEAELDFDTTVEQWRFACDLVTWRPLGVALNAQWDIRCSEEQWRAVLTPPKKRTLGDVCELIAASARREVIRPAHLLGKPCETAGAFLTVRSLLGAAGADADSIAPSTLLASYTRQYLHVFLGPISRLAPHRLPLVRIQKPLYGWAALGVLIGLALIGCGEIWDSGLTLLGIGVFACFYALMWIAAKRNPHQVEFGELRTFRDLAVAMTGPMKTKR